nr:hypothetical protein [Vibrio halioticoli]
MTDGANGMVNLSPYLHGFEFCALVLILVYSFGSLINSNGFFIPKKLKLYTVNNVPMMPDAIKIHTVQPHRFSVPTQKPIVPSNLTSPGDITFKKNNINETKNIVMPPKIKSNNGN